MLKRAFAREKQATADISHELRTPLSALLTMTEMALRKSRSPEEYQEVLRDCRLSAQRMTQGVERLLALARLDAGVGSALWLSFTTPPTWRSRRSMLVACRWSRR